MKYLILLLLFSCTPDTQKISYTPIEVATFGNDAILLDSINKYRTDLGMKPLKSEKLLTELANEHLDYIVQSGNLSHNNFEQRAKKSQSIYFGEIAGCCGNPSIIIGLYKNSFIHNEVIKDTNYTHIGIAYNECYNVCEFARY
jgi:uncharacterized protein YkwD